MKNLTPQTIKILILKFAGTFGSSMLSFAIGLYILHRTGSALSMGVTLVTGPVVSLLLTPFVGYVVDTMNHRRIMLSAQVVTSVVLVAFGLVFRVWPAQYYAELIALIIVLQVTDNFLSTTLTASLVQLFEGSELQRVNSLNQSITSLAAFLAPLIGAWLYTLVAIDTFAYVEVLFELTALVAILLLKFRLVTQPATPQPRESVLNNFKTGFAYVKNQKLILTIMISSAAVNFLFAAMNVGLPYLLIQTLKLSNQQYGWSIPALPLACSAAAFCWRPSPSAPTPSVFPISTCSCWALCSRPPVCRPCFPGPAGSAPPSSGCKACSTGS